VVECRECGGERVHDTELTDEARFRFTCTDCGTSFSP
jgi:transposase-like protein